MLFKSATGWLGWSPAEALASPMPMIEAAMEGRIEMLKAIFGGSEKKKSPAHLPPEAQAAELRGMFDRLGTKKVKRNGP
ncbi:MAG: hypothetical protein AB7E29_08340 [Xanthobacter sp.]